MNNKINLERKIRCIRCKRHLNYIKPNRLCWDCDDYSIINNVNDWNIKNFEESD
jgi:hypothetical protein